MAPPIVAAQPTNVSQPMYGGVAPGTVMPVSGYGPMPGHAGQTPYAGPVPIAPYPGGGPASLAPPTSVLDSLAGDMEPPKLDVGRHGGKHGAGKHHGKSRQPTFSMAWLGGFTILGVVVVGGAMAYYFATQDSKEPPAQNKTDRQVAKAVKTDDSDSKEPDEADEAQSEADDAPAPTKKPAARKLKQKLTPVDEQTPVVDDAKLAAAPEEPAAAKKSPKAKSAAPAPTSAKSKEPVEKSGQAARDPESESWKLDGLINEVTGTLSNGDGLLGENTEATTGKFLVLTLSIAAKKKDKIPPVSLKDVTLSINVGGQERKNLRPFAIGNNEEGQRYFTFLPGFIGDAHLICGTGECNLSRADEKEPVMLNVTVSPCRMSFAYHIPDPDESEFEFRFVDTVISGKTAEATATAKSDDPDAAEPASEP